MDLTLAKSGNCVSSATGVVRIVGDFAGTGISSMTLNLEDLLLYFAYGSSNLSSISLGERLIVNYPHAATILDPRSIASYNEYLAVTARQSVLGVFVRIRSQQPGNPLVGIRNQNGNPSPAGHLYMIREEFQPLPGMPMLRFTYCRSAILSYCCYHTVPPGPVSNVKYFPTSTSISITWSPPQYTDSGFGMFILLNLCLICCYQYIYTY